MTAKEIYEGVVVEMNKVNAESFTIEEFNYYINKAVRSLVNERYQFYQTNQQLTDDLRVLRRNAKFRTLLGSTATILKDGASVTEVRKLWNKSSAAVTRSSEAASSIVRVSKLTDFKELDYIKLGLDETEYQVTDINADSYPYTVTVSPVLVKAIDTGSPVFVTQDNIVPKDEYDIDGLTDGTVSQVYSLELPSADYLHILSCRTYWKGEKYNGSNAVVMFGAKRLTDDVRNGIENNVFLRPRYSRPYFIVEDNPMNAGVDAFNINAYKSYQNKPIMDIYTGSDGLKSIKTTIDLVEVHVEYLKNPEVIILDEVDVWSSGVDNSQLLEFPDNLTNKITSIVTDYLLGSTGNPQLSTHVQLNQQIHPDIPKQPAQSTPQQPAAQQRQAQAQ